MIFFSASLVNLLYFFFIHHLILTFASTGDVSINCGSTGNSTALDGREWIGDTGSKSISFLQPKGKSRSSMVVDKSFHVDHIHVPFMNARISSTQFHYTFPVNPGQIFIRLHFYPARYSGFENSYDLFSVKAATFTLLTNFSASHTADSLGVKYLVKEYCVNVDENEALTLLFSTSKPGDSEKTYAFINGIEIISMPTGLYYTLDGDLGASVVGKKNQFYIDNNTALEMVQRLNIGGESISPEEDSGLYRTWYNDAIYLMSTSEVYSVKYPIRTIKYRSMSRYVSVAPLGIYQTSWSTHPNELANKIYNLTWKIPVEVGFGYLIRLHFCELEPGIIKSGQREFSILINNRMAETNADVIQWTGGNGIPVHRDYMVIVKGDREKGKGSLSIVVQSKVELMDGLLNGLEIMKLSNPDNFLAYPNPEFSPQVSAPKLQKLVSVFLSKNGIATVLTIVIALINIVVYNLRKFWEAELPEVDLILPKEVLTYIPSTSTKQLCRHFSFAEIQLATENFNDGLVVGKGGFGKVYKGFIDNGENIVAIKRLAAYSKQGADEFWMEIETLSKLRHVHLVSLIGYCDESHEMILVYEYMPRGTLGDHLYGIARTRSDYSPFTWEQRLKICLGAARGLDYLHTGTVTGVIHRDVKDSNILLDDKFVAKVSDFGLAKLGKSGELNSYISTNVKGTFGYLDPQYFLTRKLSKKSDVYAFGVVMLVVLFGRPAVDSKLAEDELGLVSWAQERIKDGEVDQIIDMPLRGQISSDSLNEFVELAKKCLNKGPRERPTMAQVVVSLEFALQQNAPLIARDVDLEWTQSLPSVSEEISDVSGSTTEENSTHYGVSRSFKRKYPNNEAADLQRKNYKPARFWPWKMFRGAREKQSKDNLVLPDPIRRFSFAEIQSATHKFDDGLLLGRGLDKVYKGFIDNGANIVAIKRLDSRSEFLMEIKTLSKLRHVHLVSLIGYCDESQKMCLVYEYMPRGNLREHLYGTAKSRIDYSPLTWEQRLTICLGAARGLVYLHTDIVPGVIHRDVNDSNILLDEKFVAKVSGFGFEKQEESGELNSYISTRIIGTWGYLDPQYLLTGKLSKKSDVYAFGVVMLVVLSGRPAIDNTLAEEGLVFWAQKRIEEEEVDQIIDMTLRGKISSHSLNEFVKLATQCLHERPRERPTMAQVVAGLEYALQQNSPSILRDVEVVGHLERSQSFLLVDEILDCSTAIMDPEPSSEYER